MLILKNGWKIRAYTTEGSALVKFSAHYALSNSTTLTEDVVRGALSASGGAANAVDVLTGPSASPTDNRIDVKTLTFVNGETTTRNLTVELYDGSNASPLVGTVPLQANGSVVIADAVSIFDAQGNVLMSAGIISSALVRGMTDGSDASAGIVGEYLESVESPATVHAAPATNQYFDLTSLTLSAGDWDVTAVTLGRPNGAMNGALGVSCYMGIGRVAGNNNTGLVQSKNAVNVDCGTATSYVALSVPSYRMKITAADVSGGTNIAYIKALMTYLSGAPGFVGYRLSARRVR